MRIGGVLLVLCVLGLVAGCSSRAPKDHFYRLQASPDGVQAVPAPLFDMIEVPPFRADGLLKERALVYVKSVSPNEVNAWRYHAWAERPALMTQKQLVAYLRHAGVARMVTTPEVRARAEFEVTGHLHRMEHSVSGVPVILVELELGLVRQHDGEILHLQNYRVEDAAADSSVAAAVAAQNRAMNRIFGEFVRDLRERLQN